MCLFRCNYDWKNERFKQETGDKIKLRMVSFPCVNIKFTYNRERQNTWNDNRDPSGWISTENSGLPMNGRQPIKSNVWKTLKMNHVKVFEKKISFSIREQSSASLNCLRWYRSTSADFHRLAWMKTDEWLTLETSASETLYGGRFTSSNRLIKPDYLVVSLIDTAQQIL